MPTHTIKNRAEIYMFHTVKVSKNCTLYICVKNLVRCTLCLIGEKTHVAGERTNKRQQWKKMGHLYKEPRNEIAENIKETPLSNSTKRSKPSHACVYFYSFMCSSVTFLPLLPLLTSSPYFLSLLPLLPLFTSSPSSPSFIHYFFVNIFLSF